MKYRFYTLDVFTDRALCGNPLAVFPNAEGLDGEHMQAITREFNLSETVFVLPAENASSTRKVRIFTPGGELPFAGHPTVGTAFLLVRLGEVGLRGPDTRVVLEEGVGPVPVVVHAPDMRPTGATLSVAKLPEFGPPPPSPDEIAAALSIDPTDLMMGDYQPQAVSSGSPYLFVPVRDRSVLGRTRLDYAAWERSIKSYWAPKIHIFTFDAELPGSDVRARMFTASAGVREDPATGAAAAALAGYLGVRSLVQDGTLRWRVEQGFEMGRPSILRVEADKAEGAFTAVRVGGDCVMISQGEMEVP